MKPKLRFKEFTDDWEEKKLGSIVRVNNGKDYKELNSGDIKVYGTGGVISTVDNYLSNEDGIGIGRKGTIDKPMYLKAPFWTVDTLFYCLTAQNKYFIYYLFQTIQWKKYDESTGVPSLSKKNIENIKIQLPSLPEQEKIGTFLNLLDQRIEKAEKKISLLKEEKKGWMQKLFQQEIRFKDEQGNDYPDWEEYAIQEIYKITRGKVLAKNKVLENGSYPVYSSQTLNNGLLGYYDEYLFENAITWTTDGANAGTVNFRKGKFYCTNVCGVLLNEKGYSNKCMAEILNSVAYRYVSKVGNPKLMNNVMAEISIQFPSLLEQEKIADFLSLLDQRIEKEERKVELLKEEKKGLLQNMFV